MCLMGVIASQAISAEVQYQPDTKSIMMFPVKNSIGADKAQMADDLVIMLKDGLSITGKFMVMTYDLNSNVCIQRAVAEQKIKAEEVKTAYSTDPQGISRAQKVCKSIASDFGIIGSLDTYSFDEAKKEAKISVTVQVIRVGADAEPVTIAVTGVAAGKLDDQSQTESGIGVAALGDAADKVLSKLIDVTQINLAIPGGQQVYVPAEKHKSHNKGFLPAMLGALLLGLALGGH